MKNTLTLSLIIFVCTSTFGQLEEKMKSEGVVRGTIIQKGKEIEGYIRSMGWTFLDKDNISAPWQFQSNIRFISSADFKSKEKIKNKDYAKYSAQDIEGYKYNVDSLFYQSVKYADMSAVGTGMMAKMKFMRRIVDNKISVYHHFQSPPSVGEVSSLKATYIEYQTPDLVYKKGEKGKLKLVNSMKVVKELSDCPTVVKKYENDEYKVVGSEKKQSKMNKLLNKSVFRDEVRLAVIEDYNQTCN